MCQSPPPPHNNKKENNNDVLDHICIKAYFCAIPTVYVYVIVHLCNDSHSYLCMHITIKQANGNKAFLWPW